jgi:ABC-type sugar transport system substrate-binding protein
MPMVFMHSGMSNYGGVVLAGDDYLMGLEAGRAGGTLINDELNGEANVVILDYPDLPGLVTRADGLEHGVLEVAPNATIVGRFPGGTRENGYASVKRLIEGGTDFDVIVSINDAGSYGAIQALEEAGLEPSSIFISSIDAEALAREYIGEDYFIRASVDVGREQFSLTAVNSVIKLLAGATVPEIFLVPPGQVVTKDTLDSDDGRSLNATR